MNALNIAIAIVVSVAALMQMNKLPMRLTIIILAMQLALVSCDSEHSNNSPLAKGSSSSHNEIPVQPQAVSGNSSIDNSKKPPQREPIDYQIPIGISIILARGFEPSYGGSMGMSSGGGYQYEVVFYVGNPNSATFYFDTIEVNYTNSLSKKLEEPFYLSGQTIILTEKGTSTFFKYGDSAREPPDSTAIDKDNIPVNISLEGHRAIRIHTNTGNGIMPTIVGRPPIVINVRLFSSGKPVSEIYRAALPPLMKLPDEFRAKEDEWKRIHLVRAMQLPAPSGVFSRQVIAQVFEKSDKISPQAVLSAITPELMTIDTYKDNYKMLRPGGWNYDFWLPPNKTFSISSVDPSVVIQEGNGNRPQVTIDKPLLESGQIDCDVVVMMVDAIGAESTDEKIFKLIGMMTDKGKRLVWDISYNINGKKVYVFADTGQFVYQENNELRPFADVIWN